jgi:predicted DNA-binding transcriptional regulator AlpA
MNMIINPETNLPYSVKRQITLRHYSLIRFMTRSTRLTQSQIGQIMGKSRGWVYKMIEAGELNLAPKWLVWLGEGNFIEWVEKQWPLWLPAWAKNRNVTALSVRSAAEIRERMNLSVYQQFFDPIRAPYHFDAWYKTLLLVYTLTFGDDFPEERAYMWEVLKLSAIDQRVRYVGKDFEAQRIIEMTLE